MYPPFRDSISVYTKKIEYLKGEPNDLNTSRPLLR